MAVGHLAQDWNPKCVLTKGKGKEFHCAAYDFDGAGVVFWRKQALVIMDESGSPLSAEGVIKEYKKLISGEYADDELESFDDFEDEDKIVLMWEGSFDDDGVEQADLSEEQMDKIQELYDDCNRYWELEDNDEDDEY